MAISKMEVSKLAYFCCLAPMQHFVAQLHSITIFEDNRDTLCRHAFVKVQQHKADAEEIALAACEISHNIQSSAAYLQGTARHGTKLLEDSKQSYMPSRSLRSETGNLLIMPKACRKLGCHTFAYAVPKLWNELPVNIRTTTSLVSFRSSLNTHLFKLAYA